jgi:hypothetical protein
VEIHRDSSYQYKPTSALSAKIGNISIPLAENIDFLIAKLKIGDEVYVDTCEVEINIVAFMNPVVYHHIDRSLSRHNVLNRLVKLRPIVIPSGMYDIRVFKKGGNIYVNELGMIQNIDMNSTQLYPFQSSPNTFLICPVDIIPPGNIKIGQTINNFFNPSDTLFPHIKPREMNGLNSYPLTFISDTFIITVINPSGCSATQLLVITDKDPYYTTVITNPIFTDPVKNPLAGIPADDPRQKEFIEEQERQKQKESEENKQTLEQIFTSE